MSNLNQDENRHNPIQQAGAQPVAQAEPVGYLSHAALARLKSGRTAALLPKALDGKDRLALYLAAPTPATDQEDAMPATQEPKYGIKQNRLYNRASGEFIPADEPVFIFRARDKLAAAALEYYMHRCGDPAHQEAVFMRMADFDKFASNNPSRMKWPDTLAATPVTDQPKQGDA